MITNQLAAAMQLIEGATDPKRFFGDDKALAAVKYRQLAKLLHPDTTTAKDSQLVRAVAAFDRLVRMYNVYEGNGKPGSAGPTGPTGPFDEYAVGDWIIERPFAKGDICDVYWAHHKDARDSEIGWVFKLAQSPKNNDLMEHEYAHLGIINKALKVNRYVPTAQATLNATIAGANRRANVISAHPSNTHTLAELKSIFPKGLDFRHIVWMGNRLFNALVQVHSAGIIHGAVWPEHLVYGPTSHGLTLIDWCYSVTVESKRHIPAIVSNYRDVYPSEVIRKLPPTPATDIYMAAHSLKSAASTIPKEFKGLFLYCLADSPNARPQDSVQVADLWVKLAEEVYGLPKYVELKLPITKGVGV